jgi:HTH-type transcriptional regulator/antitoxin HigA
MKTTFKKNSDATDEYFELIERFPLVPIKSDAHLREAFRLIDELSIVDDGKLAPGKADYPMVLSDLVEKYEDEHHPARNAFKDGIDALRFILDQANLTASDLGRILGNRQLGAAVLRRQRQLSKANIIRLAEHFKVSTDLFLR